jgi:hypothetical protein
MFKAERITARLLPAAVAFLLVFVACHKVYGQETAIQTVVTKTDPLGRAQSVEVKTSGGTCMAEVTYDEDSIPRVHVLALSSEGVRHLGYLQVNDGTYESMSKEYLMWCFEKALSDYCIPLIIPGAAAI